MTTPDTSTLRSLLSEATDEDLTDGGRYFADSYTDLAQCSHGQTGEYQNRADGPVIEWLWNNRHAIADLEARALAAEAKVKEAEGVIEPARRMIDDYQTSNGHHPDHVLVSLADFTAMKAALLTQEPTQ